jgi:uncharacterized protein (TIGR00162 family)
MESTEIVVKEEVKLNNAILICGLPGIGNVGKSSVSYLIHFLKAKKFAELYSKHFLHITLVNENSEIEPMKNEFYFYKAHDKNQRDLVLLTGHMQSMSSEGQYEVSKKIVDFVKKIGVTEIITLAGLGIGELVDKPRVFGILSEKSLRKKYENKNIIFEPSVGQIFGAAGLILAEGNKQKIPGICLLGETPGFLISDPKATEAILKVLEKIINIKIDYSELNKKIAEAEKLIKKIQEIQSQAVQLPPQPQPKEKKDISYIG